MDVFDITVIGGGPTGLFALFYAGLRGAKTKIIEALPELGGQLYALYPEKDIYDMPGMPFVRASDLVAACVQQAMQWPHDVCMEERVTSIVPHNGGIFELVSDKGRHWSRSVILCSGIGAFTPRKLPTATAAQFEGRGVHYYANDLQSFAGKRVVIVGGGDSALDYALALEGCAAHILLLHRSQFRAHAKTVDRLRQSTIEIRQPDYELRAVHGTDAVEAITHVDRKSSQETTVPCDAVLAALGFVSDLTQLQSWGIATSNGGITVDPFTMETSIKGIYAAGDIVSHPGKLKLIACGTSEAAIAVNQAIAYLDPTKNVTPVHSSNLTLPISTKPSSLNQEFAASTPPDR
ncbi:MAG TPA: NAD(P)/FAD-dependent oxidoreductase [Candidatus Dormibacteraeota bacterium]|nr:NAD(P)/FAD-dependent oxidoreductase [Candidatus Dormibacteraeota bacterium]